MIFTKLKSIKPLIEVAFICIVLSIFSLNACSATSDIASESFQIDSKNQPVKNSINMPIEKTMYGETFALYIGNSFTAGTGSSSGHTGIYELTKDCFDDSRCFISMGGAFINYEGHDDGLDYVDVLTKAINDDSFDNAAITHIFIIGARGDCWARSELNNDVKWLQQTKDSILEINALISSHFTNVRYCGYAWADAYKDYGYASERQKTNYTFDVNSIIPSMFDDTCISYMGWIGWDILFARDCFSSDGYHPNDKGYQILANNFTEALSSIYKCTPKVALLENPLYRLFPSEGEINQEDQLIHLTSTPNGISLQMSPHYSPKTITLIELEDLLSKNHSVGVADDFPIKIDAFSELGTNAGTLDIGCMELLCPGERDDTFQAYRIKVSLLCSASGTALYFEKKDDPWDITDKSMLMDQTYLLGNNATYSYFWPNNS